MKPHQAAIALALIHGPAFADRYGVAEAMEDIGPFPSWGWMILFFIAVAYVIYQHRYHREVERSTHARANSAIHEARREERRLAEAVAKLESDNKAAWNELAALRNELHDHSSDAPTGSKLRAAIDRHFLEYPHVRSRAQ
jgi:hypothetical protein